VLVIVYLEIGYSFDFSLAEHAFDHSLSTVGVSLPSDVGRWGTQGFPVQLAEELEGFHVVLGEGVVLLGDDLELVRLFGVEAGSEQENETLTLQSRQVHFSHVDENLGHSLSVVHVLLVIQPHVTSSIPLVPNLDMEVGWVVFVLIAHFCRSPQLVVKGVSGHVPLPGGNAGICYRPSGVLLLGV